MTTALTSLKARMAAARASLFIDLAIPRFEPPVIVRFQPVEQSVAEKITEDTRADKSPHATVNAHARLLGRACVGLWMLDEQGAAVSVLDGGARVDPGTAELPTFGSAELGAELEVTGVAAAVRKLFNSDGDVIAMSLQLQEWSGQQGADVSKRGRDALGE